MTRNRDESRAAGIDRRTSARHIDCLRTRQRFDSIPATRRAERLAQLTHLLARLAVEDFTEQERLDAKAALLQDTPTSQQAALSLRGVRDA